MVSNKGTKVLLYYLWFCSKKEDELAERTRQLQRDIENLEFSQSSLQRQKSALEGDLQASRDENNGLKSTVSQLTASQAGIKAQLDCTEVC